MSMLAISLVIVVIINVLGDVIFHRFDLTEEKRYTLSDATVTKLDSLDDIVFVRVYLEGNLPSEFIELHNATKELLDEFRAYAGDNLQYEFINPGASPNEDERLEIYKELTRQGLQYSNVRVRTGDQMSEQIIFPGAIVSYKGRETPVQLLKSQIGATQQEMLGISIQQLEYEMMSAIRKVSIASKPLVAFIEGHGELTGLETADTEAALSEFYEVTRVAINGQLDALDGVRAIIIARPDSAYNERDKFVIDQFIMRGGRALWMIDPVFARMDSLRASNLTMGIVLEHNLEDQLFKYGARLNNDLVLDLQGIPIPVVTGSMGNQPTQEMIPWYFAPLLIGSDEHPISRNLDRMKTEFVSTIDPIEVDSVTQTTLLTSSEQCRKVMAPTRISLNILREPPRYEMFNEGPYTTAMLLEGKFPSVFKNRLPQRLLGDEGLNFRERSYPTKMIVVSDGDIIRNPTSSDGTRYFALGFDKYTNRLYGNREFILNAMNYLCDDSGLLNVRSKEFKIRLLDQAKIDENRYYFQVLNTGLPIMLVFLLGLVLFWWRKRRYVK